MLGCGERTSNLPPALIGKDGTVVQLDVASGPPLLIQAAMDAVKQWRYRAMLLVNEPVEVERYIDLIFTLGEKQPQPQ